MQIRCGVDIIEIERIKESIENPKTGKTFINKVYTPKEIEYCESKKKQKYQHYAARFASKEATFKAISDRLENKYAIDWKNIEILNSDDGKPCLNLVDLESQDILQDILRSIESVDLSISHCKQYAVANVVMIFR